jgi:hypothetical protein
MLTQQRLKELLEYSPYTGLWYKRSTGVRTGSITGSGYYRIIIEGKRYKSSRLAFLYMIGDWPKEHVDHINLDKTDDRWFNLREATRSQNMGNTRKMRTNTSGFKGVTWCSAKRKWQSQLRNKFIGRFSTPQEAHSAYMHAASEKFGEFMRAY